MIIRRIKEFIVKIIPGSLVRLFASPYVAGLGMEKGVATAKQLWEQRGIYSTLDLLGEAVETRDLVERNVKYYKGLLDLINKEGANQQITVSLKLSSMGIHESKEYCIQKLEEVLSHADQYGIPVTIDMEDSTLTEITLQIYKELLPNHPTLGTVLQTSLYRTEKDVEGFSKKNRIRLVIGIYKEPPSIALQNKPEMKRQIVKFTEKLVDTGNYVEIATHDVKTIHEVFDLIDRKKYSPDQIEFQMLLGVPRDKTHKEIQEKGFKIRLYVPFAMNWGDSIAYLKRRLLENPQIVLYVLQNLLKPRKILTAKLKKKKYLFFNGGSTFLILFRILIS